jgi:NAD(P)-dependent dehydrogenase (short-subunit alcohol dehydrogenase family)
LTKLAGRAAFVTGGAGGIGFAIAAALADEGMRVTIADVATDRLGDAVSRSGGRFAAQRLDVTDETSWREAIDAAEQALGAISMLVNSAGIGGGAAVGADAPARWKLVQEVNALGPFLGANLLIPRMRELESAAHIVNVASLAGLCATPSMSAYNASKYALVGLTDTLRGELAGSNIGVSLVYPGTVRTDFIANAQNIIADRTNIAPRPSGTENLLAKGMAPEEFARLVVAGVKAGDYHIFTHGGWGARLAAHFDDRMAAYGDESRFEGGQDLTELDRAIGAIMDQSANRA